MADPFEKLSKPADPFAKLSEPVSAAPSRDPFAKLSQPAPDSIEKEIKERGIFDRPLIVPQQVTDEELKQIATKYGTSAEDLRSALPFLGGLPQDAKVADIAKGAAGFAGEAVTLGVPQKLFRMAQDPKQEAALDELKDLVSGRKSYAQYAAEFAVPGIGTAKLAKAVGGGIKGAAAVGAAMGAAGGFGASQAGKEISGTLVGAALGAPLGAAGEAVAQRLANKAGKAITAEEKAAIQSANIEKLSERASKEAQESGNTLLDDLMWGRKTTSDLSQEEVNKVLQANLEPETIKAYTSIATEEGKEAVKKISPEVLNELGTQRALARSVLEDLVTKEKADFVSRNSSRTLSNPAAVEEAWQKEFRQYKPEDLEKVYGDWKQGKFIDKYIAQEGIHDIKPQSRIEQFFDKILDARFVLRKIDEKFNTELEPALDKLSKNRNLMGLVREEQKKSLDDLRTFSDSNATTDAVKSGKIYEAIDTGNTAALNPAEKETAQRITNEFNKLYEFVTKAVGEKGIAPLNIPKAENYVSRVTLPVPETISKVEMEMRNAVYQVNSAFKKAYTDLSQIPTAELNAALADSRTFPSVNNLQQYLNWIKGAEVKLDSGAKMSAAIRDSIRSENDIRILDKVARGSLERTAETGGIPDFIREKDIFHVLDRYSQDMLSNLYQREPLSNLAFTAKRLRALGANTEAKYIENIIEDTNGVRRGTVAHYMRDARAQITRAMDPLIDKAKAEGDETKVVVYSTIKEMGELPQFITKQIYPNVLGWRPVPIIQNALSGLARAAPEIGGVYGYTTYARGTTYAIQNWSNLVQELVAKGYTPGEWTRTGQKALADGIRASGVVDIPLKGLEYLNKIGMAVYEKSEQLNRACLLGMSKMMAYDLQRGIPAAQKALNKFPSSVQKQITRAGNDPTAIENIIMTHLNGTTAFNYNRPSLFEFGRTMGPMFATFAKWPTSIAGEIATEYKIRPMTSATKRVAERYLAPILAFAAIDSMMSDKLEDSDRLQKIIGKTGFKKAAPISSLGGFITGDMFTPPMVDTVMQDIVVPVSKGEGAKLVRGLDRTAFMYTPGAGFIKFLTEDIPTYIRGERPEGSTQTERSLRGARIIK
jgi:hypothetical protein